MATNFIDMTKKHAVCESSKLLATKGGAHIYNIKITQDMDNGTIVAKGDYKEPEVYEMKAVNEGFAGKVIGKAANGNWLIEVTDAQDAILLLNVPMIYEEYTTAMQAEYNFYNKNGDIVRGYELVNGDVFAISPEGITGTVAANKSVKVTTHKLAINE